MANKYKGEIEFDAGVDKLVLRLSVNAICDIEEAFAGKSIKEIGMELGDPERMRYSNVRTIFCCGLIDHYREDPAMAMDEAKAKAIFSRLTTADALDIVSRAFNASFDDGQGGAHTAAEGQNPPKPGDPTTSGTGPAFTPTGAA